MEKYADKQDKSKQDKMKIEIQKEGTFSLMKGENVLSVLIEHNLFDKSHCAGNGTCGKCKICFLSGAPLPLPADRRFFQPDELRTGWRLACKAKPKSDCVISMPESKKNTFILEQAMFLDSVVLDGKNIDNNSENGGDVIAVVDLGTTTMVGLLVAEKTGKVLRMQKCLNPQRIFGADVVSRMQASLSGKKDALSEMVNKVVTDMISDWKKDGIVPKKIVLAGNTVMTHLYLNQDVSGLSKAPFIPVTTVSVPFEVVGIQGVTMPAISAFVGGDISAGMLVCDKLMEAEQIKRALLIDLGTNGEMVLFTPERNYATATAAGPAFEGGFGSVLYGADVIALTSELVKQGIVDETGLMIEPYFETGYQTGEYRIRQEDIRTLQMAKAAVFAGIRILCEKAEISPAEIESVYLAGGFGYKLSVTAAVQIGLIPAVLGEKTTAVGNTALSGAWLYGVGTEAGERMKNMIEKTESINLAQKENFQEYYLQAMSLKEEREVAMFSDELGKLEEVGEEL